MAKLLIALLLCCLLPCYTYEQAAQDNDDVVKALDEVKYTISTYQIDQCPYWADTIFYKNHKIMTNKFALDWYKEVVKQIKHDGNVVLSPLSMQTVLAQLYLGMDDKAAEMEIGAKLFQGSSKVEAAEVFTKISRSYDSRNTFQNGVPKEQIESVWKYPEVLTRYMANLLLTKDTKVINDSKNRAELRKYLDLTYRQELQNCFGTVVMQSADMTNEGTNLINKLAKGITRGMIPSVLTPEMISKDVNMVLVNALYFNATWEHPFTDGGETYEDDFFPRYPMNRRSTRNQPTTRIRTTFMTMHGAFPYFSNDDVIMLALNYTGGKQTMYLAMPQKRISLEAFENKISYSTMFLNWQKQLRLRDVIVTLPKFEMNMDLQAVDSLKAMGVKRLFSEFRQRRSEPATDSMSKVDILTHKVVLQVHERGNTGAAVSAAAGVTTNWRASFNANRPFVFVIYDHEAEADASNTHRPATLALCHQLNTNPIERFVRQEYNGMIRFVDI